MCVIDSRESSRAEPFPTHVLYSDMFPTPTKSNIIKNNWVTYLLVFVLYVLNTHEMIFKCCSPKYNSNALLPSFMSVK